MIEKYLKAQLFMSVYVKIYPRMLPEKDIAPKMLTSKCCISLIFLIFCFVIKALLCVPPLSKTR